MYRLGRLRCTWNLGTICPRTEREHGETCRSLLLCCARVQDSLCGGDIRHVTGLPNRSVGDILNCQTVRGPEYCNVSTGHSGVGRRVAFIDNVFIFDIPVGHISIWPNRPLEQQI